MCIPPYPRKVSVTAVSCRRYVGVGLLIQRCACDLNPYQKILFVSELDQGHGQAPSDDIFGGWVSVHLPPYILRGMSRLQMQDDVPDIA